MAVNERTFVRSSGTHHEPHLSDILINDVEHPELINSSLSDEEHDLVLDNNNETVSFTLSQKPTMVGTDIDIVRVFPSLAPPPPSPRCFEGYLVKALPGNKLWRSPGDVFQTQQEIFTKTIQDRKEEAQRAVQRTRAKQAEVLSLKESIKNLQSQKQQLGQEYAELVPHCENKVKDATAKLLTCQKVFQKSEDKLKDKKENRGKLKERLDFSKRKYKAVTEEDAQLTNWTLEHSIDLHIKAKSSLNPDSMDEVVFELYNINPRNPNEPYHILADSMASKEFSVSNIFPEFEEANEVIERANKSQNLLQLLKDCKQCWQRDCAKQNSSNNMPPAKAQTSPDQSMVLFESPPLRTRGHRRSISDNVVIG